MTLMHIFAYALAFFVGGFAFAAIGDALGWGAFSAETVGLSGALIAVAVYIMNELGWFRRLRKGGNRRS